MRLPLGLLYASLIASTALSAPSATSAKDATISPSIRAALADPMRPQADVTRDSTRHPGELLTMAGIRPGMKVGDFIMGGGYFTRILARTVGPKGKVYAYQPAEFIAYRPAYGEEQKATVADYRNTVPLSMKLGEIAFPEKLDAIITVQNYHDLHLKFGGVALADAVNKRLFDALKPGGTLLVIDHVANSDPGFAAPDTLHRIDPAAARAEIERAGFQFVSKSDLLHNASDPHSANVFDPAIRGKTDQFVYLFRKPKR